MSITPSATAGTTIAAADENTRNSNITTTYNNHSHTDISQTANTLAVGDAAAGNKTIQANNADTNKPFVRYDDTNDRWIISHDGSTIRTILSVTGATVGNHILPSSAPSGSILRGDGNAWQNVLAGANGTELRVVAGVPAFTTNTPNSGSFTRDISTAAGSQAITGVGFKPSSIIIACNIASAAHMSIGFSDGTTDGGIVNRHSETAEVFGVMDDLIISMVQGASIEGNAAIASFDDNGFTLSWTKVGSPTGTATCRYQAFR